MHVNWHLSDFWRGETAEDCLPDKYGQTLQGDLKILRFLVVTPAAIATTFFLVWGMERLIHAEEYLEIPEPEVYKVPDPVMVEPPPIKTVYERPKPPEPVEMIPDPPTIEIALAPLETGGVAPVASPLPPVKPGLGFFTNDTPIATMLVQPAYPAYAANKGLEGYVDVQFDVAATGATENIVVLAAVPPNVFDRETIKAVKRWKFNPVIKDGNAVVYKSMVQRVNFEMEKR